VPKLGKAHDLFDIFVTSRVIRFKSSRLSNVVAWLERPISTTWCVVGWILATAIFVTTTLIAGIPAGGDATASSYISWALAHGHYSCGFPPGGVGSNQAAPLYPLVAGGLSALFRIGHSVPFPTQAELGRHCANAFAAINTWVQNSDAWGPTLRIGFVGWLALMAGVIALLRASGRGRRGWEPLALAFMAIVPPVSFCLVEFFHPQDLLAMGLALGGLAFALRGRWTGAGFLIGLAILSHQFALLFFLPMLVVAPKESRLKFAASSVAAVALVSVPVILFTSGRAWASIFVGTGGVTYNHTLLVQTGIHPPLLLVVARTFPTAGAVAMAWWAMKKLGASILEPVPLVSLIATCLCLRLVFEVNLWGYYFMAVAVILVILDVVRGRVRVTLIALLVMLKLVAIPLIDQSQSLALLLDLQAILVASAIGLSASPLIATINSLSRKALFQTEGLTSGQVSDARQRDTS
jgi:hypothetical protein